MAECLIISRFGIMYASKQPVSSEFAPRTGGSGAVLSTNIATEIEDLNIMPLRISSGFSPEKPGWRRAGAFVCLLGLAVAPAAAQLPGQLPMASEVLTNINQIWTVPHDHRAEQYRIRTEMVIYFVDKEWGNAAGECGGVPRWLPIFDCPTPLKAGERIAIDGVIVPSRERFVWEKTQVRILEENIPLPIEPLTDLGRNPRAADQHFVSVEGLVDSTLEDSSHFAMRFLDGTVAAQVFVLKGTNTAPLPFRSGDLVRMKCVYSPQFDRDGNLNDLSLWVSGPANIEIIGSLKTDPRFSVPITPSEAIQTDTLTGGLVRVEGIVRKYEPSHWVTLWDNSGQVMVQSLQSQPLRLGDRLEAVGHPYVAGVQKCLQNAIYRLSDQTNASPAMASTNAFPLCLAEHIRNLSPEEARRHLPVRLRGIVAWHHDSTPFVYVLDASGGIRVVNPKWDSVESTKPGTIVVVEGETAEGDFVPVVTNAVVSRNGWWNIEDRRPITLEQALTGLEEGNWVEMRGFVRGLEQTNGLVCFDLSTSFGEFRAWTPASQSFESLKDSIIHVEGICSAVVNPRSQLTGVQIWTPDVKYIQIEEAAPWDVFAAPLHPLSSLRRFNMATALNQRIRTAGTVVLQAPGRYLCVQDGGDSVFALSQQTNRLQPGDNVEVVGFPGRQGQKFVLREAVYRRTGSGSEPAPVPLSLSHSTEPDSEGLLARATGTLLNTMATGKEIRLLIRNGYATFEASLDAGSGAMSQIPPLGSRLALTGVYEIQNDEYGQPQSFLLQLRSGQDVQVLQQPPWWTLARLLWALVAVTTIFLMGLVWGFLIARKNALLRQAQSELQAANDLLENRVAERTRELRDEIADKEQARVELAQAQRSLMLASRQAGMAEVATGLLHNIGNVLNSVNVSATILHDQTRTSETGSLVKIAELIKQNDGDLKNFLTSDPRGKILPEFIVKISSQLRREQENAGRELALLTKNIDHIKDIIARQQSYARLAGVLEKVALGSLVEDALQIDAASLERHAIAVTRRFEELPPLMLDKHKVLQILINLIRNAKDALDEGAPERKELTVTVARADDLHVKVEVRDNGVGIRPENLTRIFSHGFTTRSNGHGFGLHLGAINAREMGGSLSAASDGLGQGATFTLILPIEPPGKGS